jgi:hypothetical protein
MCGECTILIGLCIEADSQFGLLASKMVSSYHGSTKEILETHPEDTLQNEKSAWTIEFVPFSA